VCSFVCALNAQKIKEVDMNDLKPIKKESWIDIVNAGIDIKSPNTRRAYKRDL
jgi:hypothetical protein